MISNWKIGLSYSLVTTLFWGLLPIALAVLLEQMDSVTITWYRFLAAAIIAWIWYGRRRHTALIELCRGPMRFIALLAVLSLVINYVLFLHGLHYVTPAAAEIVINGAPLLLLLGGVFIFNESFSKRQWMGVAIFVFGLLLFFHHRLRELVATDSSYFFGIGLVVLAAILWTVYGLSQKKLLQKHESRDLLLLIYASGALLYLPFTAPLSVLALSTNQLLLLAFVSLNTIIAYGSFGYAMSHWEASRVSAVITLAPLVTLGFSALMNWLAPGSVAVEPMDAVNWAGGLLVVVGSIMAAMATD